MYAAIRSVVDSVLQPLNAPELVGGRSASRNKHVPKICIIFLRLLTSGDLDFDLLGFEPKPGSCSLLLCRPLTLILVRVSLSF